MNHLFLFVLGVLAFAALALAMERHQDDLFGRALALRTTRLLRIAGWSAMVLMLFAAVRGQGWGLGLVSFSSHTSLAAGLVFCLLLGCGRGSFRGGGQ